MTSAVAGESHRPGAPGFVPIATALLLAAGAAICLIIPNQINDALGRTATVISEKRAAAGDTLASVVSTIATDRDDELAPSLGSAPGATVLKRGQGAATDDESRTVMTSGHDILRLEPRTAIVAESSELGSPATVIELLYGTLHVTAARRREGETLSIETQFLVATVKGTEFEVAALDNGTAVSVTEGLVSIRSAISGEALDVTPGQTAVVSALHGALPTIIATPDRGWLEAIEAAIDGSDGEHPGR